MCRHFVASFFFFFFAAAVYSRWLWSPYVIGQTIIFSSCGFFLLLSIFFYSLPNLSRRRLDVCRTSTRGVALVANLECMSEIQDAKMKQKNCHLLTIAQLCRVISSQLRHVLTIGKKLFKQQYLLHMTLQYGELRPTSGWDGFISLWRPSIFQRFRVLASLLRQRKPTKLYTMFGRLLLGYAMYTFLGALAA